MPILFTNVNFFNRVHMMLNDIICEKQLEHYLYTFERM